MEDRLEELEVRIRDILNSLIAKSSVSSVHNHENAISQTNSKLKLEIKLPEIPLPVFRDRETRKQFEQSIDSNQIPELDTFIMFLEKRSQTIDSINRSAPITHKPKQVPFHKGSFDKFEEKSYCGLAINAEINSDSLNQQLQAFWEIEKVDKSSIEYSLEEEICETHYQNTHYRTEEGRYVVQLPLKKIHTV
ncbi:hypothetical protein TNCV_4435631 [Trichonephila clavipes]|nr:hypothetical protein TNCV_4435631 [Trichonephila clavipes]